MTTRLTSRLSAASAYVLPVIGWLYIFLFQRKDKLAIAHLCQAIGLALFLIGTLMAWAVVAWVLTWIPYAALLSVALFAIVIAGYLYGVIAWIWGLLHALGGQLAVLPLFGRWASRLSIGN